MPRISYTDTKFPYSSNPRILVAPTEILTQILSECSQDTLLNIRLSNSRLESISTPLIFRSVRLTGKLPEVDKRIRNLLRHGVPSPLASYIRNLVINIDIKDNDMHAADGLVWEEFFEECLARLSSLTLCAFKPDYAVGDIEHSYPSLYGWRILTEKSYPSQYGARMMHRLGRIFHKAAGKMRIKELEIRTDQLDYVLQLFDPWLRLRWTDELRHKMLGLDGGSSASSTTPAHPGLFETLEKLKVVTSYVYHRGHRDEVKYTPGCVSLLANGCRNLKNLHIAISRRGSLLANEQTEAYDHKYIHGSRTILLDFRSLNPLSIRTLTLDEKLSMNKSSPLVAALRPLKHLHDLTLKNICIWSHLNASNEDNNHGNDEDDQVDDIDQWQHVFNLLSDDAEMPNLAQYRFENLYNSSHVSTHLLAKEGGWPEFYCRFTFNEFISLLEFRAAVTGRRSRLKLPEGFDC